jgi:hypothetical protein
MEWLRTPPSHFLLLQPTKITFCSRFALLSEDNPDLAKTILVFWLPLAFKLHMAIKKNIYFNLLDETHISIHPDLLLPWLYMDLQGTLHAMSIGFIHSAIFQLHFWISNPLLPDPPTSVSMTFTGDSGLYLLHVLVTMGFLRSFPFLLYTLYSTSYVRLKVFLHIMFKSIALIYINTSFYWMILV